MRVLWISCLLLGIVTTLPTRRGTVTPRTSEPDPLFSRESGFYFNPRPFGIDDPTATGAATPPLPARERSFYFNPKPFGIDDPPATGTATPPVPASGVPYKGRVDANLGYDPWGNPLPGYEGGRAPPVDANLGYDPWGNPLPGYEGGRAPPVDANLGYDPWGNPLPGYEGGRAPPVDANLGYDPWGNPLPGYEGGRAPPVPASGVPYKGRVDANLGYDPWGNPLPGYEGGRAPPVPAPVVPYAGYPVEHAAGYAAPQPHVPETGSRFMGYYPLPYYETPSPDSPYPVSPYYVAPVATTHPDGQEAPVVAPDYYGHYWGSVGGDANEPVFSDVSDLAPVSSSNSRSRHMRGSTVFYEATYVPEEGPAVMPAETSSAPEEALGGPATRLNWFGMGPLLPRRPAETSSAPEEALGGPATRPTPWMGYPTGPLLPRRPAETSYTPELALGGPATRPIGSHRMGYTYGSGMNPKRPGMIPLKRGYPPPNVVY